jgi:energy-coupling factor transporter ATP-binding protein EcfA2
MQMNSRVYAGAFNFKGTDQQKKVGFLSGGERNRVHMAKLLKSGGNVLLLDEPTNDLDVETLQALEAAIEDFAGCAIIISHDRFFLDRLCTHILAFEGDAHVEWFEGNFQAYEEDKVRRLGPDALEPKRVKYKRFARCNSVGCVLARTAARPVRQGAAFAVCGQGAVRASTHPTVLPRCPRTCDPRFALLPLLHHLDVPVLLRGHGQRVGGRVTRPAGHAGPGKIRATLNAARNRRAAPAVDLQHARRVS